MTKIAIFPPSLQSGGIRQVALNLGDGFSEAGYEVDMLLLNRNEKNQLSHHINPIILGAKRTMFSPRSLIKYFRQNRPDYIIALTEPCNFAAITACMLSKYPVPIIATVHNTLSLYISGSTNNREKLYGLLARWFYVRADYVVAVSYGVEQDLIKNFNVDPNYVKTIYSPIQIDTIIEKSNEALTSELMDHKQVPIILTVGRLEPQKDFETLIRAFAHVLESRQCKLWIVGDGSQKNQLIQLGKDLNIINDIVFIGLDSNPLKYMKQADVFVLSSIYEGFGIVLVEALACGCNIVSTNCPSGPAEILDNGLYGQLVSMKDPQSMANAILATLENPINSNVLLERSRKFSVSRSIQQYIDLFNSF